MYTRGRTEAPRRERGGMTTSILLQLGDVNGSALTITWVEVQPVSRQGMHAHEPEQAYVVVKGQGRMHVGAETIELSVGDLAHVPPKAPHYIINMGREVLAYVSVATPAFSQTAFYDEGKL